MRALSIESVSGLPRDESSSEYLEELRQKLLKVLNILVSDPKYAELFARPVTPEIAPDYYKIIHKPIDYWTLEKRLKSIDYYYKNPHGFAEDIRQMIDNCKVYNTSDSMLYRYAIETMRKFKRVYAEEFPENKGYDLTSKNSSENLTIQSEPKQNRESESDNFDQEQSGDPISDS